MADQISLCLVTSMDHLWFHHIILFPEPTSLLSKTLKATSSSLTLPSPLDEVEKLQSPIQDEKESSDSSPISTLQKDDSYNNEEKEGKEMSLKERPTRLKLHRGRSNRSQSSSPSAQKRPKKRLPSTSKLQKSLSCRSLIELELEEVKGFMDLGFRFNKEHLSPRMMSLLPGLQRAKLYRLAKDDETIDQGGEYEKGKMRPYLSEAWLIKRPGSPLLNLKMPRVTAVADMKKHLQFWAKTVASVVQQEC